jgi:hypothetical protein
MQTQPTLSDLLSSFSSPVGEVEAGLLGHREVMEVMEGGMEGGREGAPAGRQDGRLGAQCSNGGRGRAKGGREGALASRLDGSEVMRDVCPSEWI